MAKFILGLLMGFIVGILFEAYADNGGLHDLAIQMRGELAKYMPINN
jgi:hypothetical protein